jgi:hypothetical protein
MAISFFFFQYKGIAQKTDTVYHINGNILTGDFKKMVYGVAIWKMDGMGTISLEEVKINTMKSDKLFEIKMEDGLIYFGSFDTSNINRKVYIKHASGRDLISINDIVEIYPIKRNFWTRTSGNFSAGLNYSKGSNLATLTFSGNLDYRKRNTYFNLTWDDNNTIQADTLSSSKSDITFAWQRLLKNNWSAELSVGTEQNTELGTKLRLDLYALGLKDIIYNDWNRLYVGGGLSVNRETPYDDSGVTNDLAGLLQVVWKVFKYTIPKVWVDANINYLPYFTGPARHRIVFNLNPQVSLFSDNFKAGLSMYYNYDSNPVSDASRDDYGINLQLTYSFH